MEQNLKMIALEGLIGVGKSTLCKKIKDEYKDALVYQESVNKLILNLFYGNPARYGFALQWGMLQTRTRQLEVARRDYQLRQGLKTFILWDRSLMGDYIFALWNHLQGTISKEELEVYESELGGTLSDFNKFPFLKDIGLFVYLYDEPSECKFRVERIRKHESEKNIPLSYYEGIDALHFFVFIFKVFTNPQRRAIVLAWGQYHEARNTLDLFRKVLAGDVQTATVAIVSITDVPRDNNYCGPLWRHYSSEADIKDAAAKIRGHYDKEKRPKYKQVFIPMDILTMPTKEKNAVENDYHILFYQDEFKLVVLDHLAHFEDVKLYKST